MTAESAPEQKSLSKDEVKAYLADIEEKVIASNGAYMHSIVALNQILRQPGAEKLVDAKMKEQMHDLWVKLRSHGVQLTDPPLLFGLPDDFNAESEEVVIDDEPEIVIAPRKTDEEEVEEEDEGDDDLPVSKEGKLLS